MNKPLVLVLGSTGLLGEAFRLVSKEYDTSFEFVFPVRKELDLTDLLAVRNYIKALKPNFVINCAGQNDVRGCVIDEVFLQAIKLNSLLPYELARLSASCNFSLITFSSDYVFDGAKDSYIETDLVNPLNRYGLTKVIGEQLVLGSDTKASIFRTAWLFGPGKENFVSKILNKARGGEDLKIVNDQFGSPTFTIDIANYVLENLLEIRIGLCHLVNSDFLSWYVLATKACEFTGLDIKIQSASTKDFSFDVNRPLNSRLNSYYISKLRSTDEALEDYIINY